MSVVYLQIRHDALALPENDAPIMTCEACREKSCRKEADIQSCRYEFCVRRTLMKGKYKSKSHRLICHLYE
ncbi:5294_t:CDS:2 [Diversispora eburnea]|uniref:5294_t:CDS:1 n=1 Tax=Diversispora eburnea TaxID=1213867 RepID=A0A9N8YMK5_9GLOM|nr:5294_t:CDS:2 [Diversispora eburnea]